MDANFSLGYFTGINTVDPIARLAPLPVKVGSGMKSAYPLAAAINVDIDNTYGLSSRSGSTKRFSGTDIHSFWSNGTDGFFMDGSVLYRLNYVSDDDYTATQLLAGLVKEKMSYYQVNDRVYMTNGSYIGYYCNSIMNSLTVPVATYKMVMPAGQRVAYHRGKLLVAKGSVLYIADVLCDHYDIRTGFKVFENNITMVLPIDDGIYVADGKVWYLAEKRLFSSDPAEYSKNYVSNLDAIPFSDVVIDGEFVGEGIQGKVAMWSTSEGVCVGDNKGAFKIVTPKYLMPPAVEGAAAIRNINGVVHYLATVN